MTNPLSTATRAPPGQLPWIKTGPPIFTVFWSAPQLYLFSIAHRAGRHFNASAMQDFVENELNQTMKRFRMKRFRK